MTTPREPDGPYGRDPYGRDPYDERGGYGSPGPYGSEPEYGWQQPEYEPVGGYGTGQDYGTPRRGERYEPPPPPPPPPPRRAARTRRRPPWIPVAAAAVVVLAVLVLGFVAPGWFVTRVLDASAVQTGIAKILTEDYGAEGVTDVRCPDRVQVVPDATFTCDATIDGDPVTVPIRVTDDDGGYEVGRPT